MFKGDDNAIARAYLLFYGLLILAFVGALYYGSTKNYHYGSNMMSPSSD